jgi:hypothetical protein
MPFDGALLHFLSLIAVAVFSGTMCNKAGMLFTEHPDRPRTSMLLPIMQSAMNTIRMIDNFTDISTIRLVIAQVWTGHCAAVCTLLPPGVLDLYCLVNCNSLLCTVLPCRAFSTTQRSIRPCIAALWCRGQVDACGLVKQAAAGRIICCWRFWLRVPVGILS